MFLNGGVLICERFFLGPQASRLQRTFSRFALSAGETPAVPGKSVFKLGHHLS